MCVWCILTMYDGNDPAIITTECVLIIFIVSHFQDIVQVIGSLGDGSKQYILVCEDTKLQTPNTGKQEGI